MDMAAFSGCTESVKRLSVNNVADFDQSASMYRHLFSWVISASSVANGAVIASKVLPGVHACLNSPVTDKLFDGGPGALRNRWTLLIQQRGQACLGFCEFTIAEIDSRYLYFDVNRFGRIRLSSQVHRLD